MMTTSSARPRDQDDAEAPLAAELTALFDRNAGFVWRVLERLGTPRADLDDALQEVFLVVLRKLPSYEDRGEEKAWLFTIARQVASHARRSTQRRTRRERSDEVHVSTGADPHAALERSEAARFVQGFLDNLDERQATVFYLADVEGLSAPEIAACLQVGVNTIYGRLRLAREQFERALRRQGR